MEPYKLVEYGKLCAASASPQRRAKAQHVLADELFEELQAADVKHAQRRFERARLRGEEKRHWKNKRVESYTLFDWDSDTATARSWVGVLQVPGAQVEVMPKVNDSGEVGEGRRSLVMMLTYAGMLKPRLMGAASVEHDAQLTFLDVLIEMFGEQLEDELRRGVDRGYVVQAADLECVRGRIDVKRQIVHHAGRPTPLACVYDSFEADTELNRALKYACRVLARRTSSFYAQRVLRASMMSLDEVSDVVMSPEQLGQIQLTRQNERFRDALELARLLLSGESAAPQVGASRSFSLCFDMNKIYERFVAGYLRELFEGKGVEVLEQGEDGRALWHNQKTDKPRLELLPDVILKRGEARIIIDAKWKRLDKKSGDPVSREDLYQLYAYGQEFKSKEVVLLYPGVGKPDEGKPDEGKPPWHYRYEGEHKGGVERLSVEFIEVLKPRTSPDVRVSEQLLKVINTALNTH